MDEVDPEVKCVSFAAGENQANDSLHGPVSQIPRVHLHSVHCGTTPLLKVSVTCPEELVI